MRGVSTHFSDPNISTACTTALKNIPKTLDLPPSYPIILSRRAKFFPAFLRFPTAAGQFSSAAVKTRPRYSKEVTVLGFLS